MPNKAFFALTVAAALSAGCLVQIETVRDPRPRFAEARREAMRLQGRRGPAHELNVLVYEPDERKLVRVSIPMWLALKIESHVDWDKELDFDDDDRRRVERTVRRHVNLKELARASPGILIEVDDDDGEQVLVWLR
jgi:hypothetical protein